MGAVLRFSHSLLCGDIPQWGNFTVATVEGHCCTECSVKLKNQNDLWSL